MRSFASFVARIKEWWLEYEVYDLLSHHNTRAVYDIAQDESWLDVRYAPSGPCAADPDDVRARKIISKIADTWPTFEDFLKDAMSASLDPASELMVLAYLGENGYVSRIIDSMSYGQLFCALERRLTDLCLESDTRDLTCILKELLNKQHPLGNWLLECMLMMPHKVYDLINAQCRLPDDFVRNVRIVQRFKDHPDIWIKLAPQTKELLPEYLLHLVHGNLTVSREVKWMLDHDWGTVDRQKILADAVLASLGKYMPLLFDKIDPEFHSDLTDHVQCAINKCARIRMRWLKKLPFDASKLTITPQSVEHISKKALVYLTTNGAEFVDWTYADLVEYEGSASKLVTAIQHGLRLVDTYANDTTKTLLENKFGWDESMIRQFLGTAVDTDTQVSEEY